MAPDLRETADHLIRCLRQQADLFGRFLELLAQQREALVRRDTESLERVTLQQEQTVSEAQRLEKQRQVITEQLAAQAHSAAADTTPGLTLAEVCRLVEASRAAEFIAVQERLRGMQAEMDRRRQINTALIEESMRCTGETLQWIARTTKPQPTYPSPRQATAGASQLAVNRHC